MAESKIIRVCKKNLQTKDGRPFTAWETTDKTGRRVSVHFCKDTPIPADSGFIELKDAWMDKRYVFPLLRVRSYEAMKDDDALSATENHSDIEDLPF